MGRVNMDNESDNREAVRARKRKIMADYRQRHPDRVRQRSKAHYAAHKAERSKANKEYRKLHAEELKRKRDQYVLSNKEKVAESQRNTRNKCRMQALEAYGGPSCSCCGCTDVKALCIDHTDGGGNAHRRGINRLGGYAFHVWLKQSGYPPGYRVLCINCNDAMALFGYCPHAAGVAKKMTPTQMTPTQKWFAKVKAVVMERYGGPDPKCARCGEPHHEFLCLDHINNDGAADRATTGGRGGYSTYRKVIEAGFPDGFRVLCFKCNFLLWMESKIPACRE